MNLEVQGEKIVKCTFFAGILRMNLPFISTLIHPPQFIGNKIDDAIGGRKMIIKMTMLIYFESFSRDDATDSLVAKILIPRKYCYREHQRVILITGITRVGSKRVSTILESLSNLELMR